MKKKERFTSVFLIITTIISTIIILISFIIGVDKLTQAFLFGVIASIIFGLSILPYKYGDEEFEGTRLILAILSPPLAAYSFFMFNEVEYSKGPFIKGQREYVGLKEQFLTASRPYDESLTSFLLTFGIINI